MARIRELIEDGELYGLAAINHACPDLGDEFWANWDSMTQSIEASVKDDPLLRLDNVTQYLSSHDQSVSRDAVLVPSYKSMFCEASTYEMVPGIDEFACLAARTEREHVLWSSFLPTDNFKWLVEFWFLMRTGARFGLVPFKYFFLLNADGRLIWKHDKSFHGGYLLPTDHTEWEKYFETTAGSEFQDVLTTFLHTTLFSLDFMNCKNVVEQVVKPSRQVRRQADRKGKPIREHRVLVVDPSKTSKRYQFSGNGTSLPKSLHLRKGHFKTFTEKAPLFGKWVGRYWWEGLALGSEEEGEVIKDYELMPSLKTNKKAVA